jgi:hypothetical protein
MTVSIHSTPELPTRCDGGKGTIWKRHHRYTDFLLVLVWQSGETAYFHESQLKKVDT